MPDPVSSQVTVGRPTVTIVVPCRDEASCIDDSLSALLKQDYPGVIEVLVAEGRSRDDTRARVGAWVARDSRVQLIDNPEGIVPTGLNRAIRRAAGEIVVRADAHSRYAEDYVSRCVEVLIKTGAANVGGPALLAGDSNFQRAFALASASLLTLGGARSKQPEYEGPVDTVQYGCWRRDTLINVGLFDEAFVRNQDDELNLRITRGGGVVWQSTAIRSWLTARPTLGGLFHQYWQYGYWKVLILAKHGSPASIRHLVPAMVVALGIFLVLSAPFSSGAYWTLLILVLTYAIVVVGESIRICRGQQLLAPRVMALIPTVHLAYGLGFLGAMVDRMLGRLGNGDLATRLTR